MSGKKLTVNVVLSGENGEPVTFLAGDVPPAWAMEQLGDHCFAAQDDQSADDSDDDTKAPPKSGKGSGAPAWHAYAAANGVEVDEDASRDDVIAACDAAGVATE